MEIDCVDHVKRCGYHSKDIKWIWEQKDNLLRNWGVCVDTIFWKKMQVKGEAADEKQSAIGWLRKEKDGQQDSPIVRGIQPSQ
jgi:hypothetical protein